MKVKEIKEAKEVLDRVETVQNMKHYLVLATSTTKGAKPFEIISRPTDGREIVDAKFSHLYLAYLAFNTVLDQYDGNDEVLDKILDTATDWLIENGLLKYKNEGGKEELLFTKKGLLQLEIGCKPNQANMVTPALAGKMTKYWFNVLRKKSRKFATQLIAELARMI